MKNIKHGNKSYLYIIFSLLSLFISGCGADEAEQNTILETPYESNEFLMGTYVSLRIYDEGKEDVLDEGIERIKELDKKLSSNTSGSEIGAINAAAGESAVAVSDDVYPLIKIAAEYSALPDSGFDYTVGAITDLWRIGFDDARVPNPEEIEQALPLVNDELVELNDEDQSVFLTEAGMQLDLGAIAKGYIADEVKKVFEENGVTTAIIDLGGNVVVMGDSPKRDTGGWNVGVQDPISTRGNYVGTMTLTDASIVTSGTYERYIETDEGFFHHLMDPDTGYPFDNNLASVTIITEKSVDADALATVVFGMEIEDGLEYLNKSDIAEGIFISDDNEVYTSDGAGELFSLTNDEFTWINE